MNNGTKDIFSSNLSCEVRLNPKVTNPLKGSPVFERQKIKKR